MITKRQKIERVKSLIIDGDTESFVSHQSALYLRAIATGIVWLLEENLKDDRV